MWGNLVRWEVLLDTGAKFCLRFEVFRRADGALEVFLPSVGSSSHCESAAERAGLFDDNR